jgi:hypothetical protein
VQDAIPTLLYRGIPESEHATRTASRLVMLGLLVLQLVLIRAAWARKRRPGLARGEVA